MCGYLRDLGGGDPYEHDGDDEDQSRAVLDVGPHITTPLGLPPIPTNDLSSPARCGRTGGRRKEEASNLTAGRGVVWVVSPPARVAGESRPHACGG